MDLIRITYYDHMTLVSFTGISGGIQLLRNGKLVETLADIPAYDYNTKHILQG